MLYYLFDLSQVDEVPHVKIFRFESSLYYANQEHFVQKLFSKTGLDPRSVATDYKPTKNDIHQQLRKRSRQNGECREVSEGFVFGSLKIHFHFLYNSLLPSDTIWQHKSGSTLAQVMAGCLTAPSHYLNQCWVIIIKVLWYSHKGYFKGKAHDVSLRYEFENL